MEGVAKTKYPIFLLFGLFLLLLPSFSCAKDHLLINEVYYDTIGTDSKEEFVEIYNPTDNEIDLTGYKLTDSSPNGEYFFSPTTIGSKNLLVIARDGQGFNDLFGFLPNFDNLTLSLNNSGDSLNLFDNSGDLLDRLSWEEGNKNSHPGAITGESLERSPVGFDSDVSSDFIATSPTPGIGLSASPIISNIETGSNWVKLDYEIDLTNNFEQLEVYLKSESSNYQLVKSYLSLPATIDLEGLDLATEYSIKLVQVNQYDHGREIKVYSNEKIFLTGYDFSDQIIINEIYPSPGNNDEEYLELYNRSSRPVNLTGWKISDEVKQYQFNGITIGPKSYLVIYQFQSGISFNNGGDIAYLIYPDGEVSDQFDYQSTDKGISWSRKGDDWFKSHQPTPGLKNIFNVNEIGVDRVSVTKIKKVFKLEDETIVMVKGWLSVPLGKFGKQIIYIEDKTGGIQIYNYHGNWPKLKLGQKVIVTGVISTVRGEKRIKIASVSDIEVIGRKKIKPSKFNWSKPKQQLGKLVTIEGRVSSSAGSTFYLEKNNIIIKVYLKESASIDKPSTDKGSLVSVTGVLVNGDSGLKIMPRSSNDLKLILSPGISSNQSLLFGSGLGGGMIDLASSSRASPGGKLAVFNNLPGDYRQAINRAEPEADNGWLGYFVLLIGTAGMIGVIGYGKTDQYIEI